MDGTQIQEMYSEMDALVAALQNDNTEELKKLTGQGEGGGDRVGLPRLGINYDQVMVNFIAGVGGVRGFDQTSRTMNNFDVALNYTFPRSGYGPLV